MTLPFSAAARHTDPTTSHEAAAEVNVNARCAQVLAALRQVEYPPHGATCFELQQTLLRHQIHMDIGWIASRLRDLEKAGLVRKTADKRAGGTSRKQTVWVLS